MPAQSPKELHEMFAKAMNAGDAEALMALYEPEAALVPPGSAPSEALRGADERRGLLSGFLAMNPTVTVESSSECIEVGDLAFISGTWTITAEGPDGPVNVAGTSADVARRQSDGSWLFVIDHPNGVK